MRPEHPQGSIPLGDPSLLKLDMSQASAYFGIAVPIMGRDRKSGAKKRTEHELEGDLKIGEIRVA